MSKTSQDQIAKRLKELRYSRGFRSAAAASRALGEDKPTTYQQYENGTRPLTMEPAVKIAKKFGASLDWLLLGSGEMKGDPDVSRIPLLTWVSAGDMMREEIADEALGWIRVSDLPKDGDWLALKVHGDSMDRISPPESVIIVNRKDKRLIANACYVIDDGEGNATYKRYRPDPMRFEPVSVNPDHETIFPDNDPTIVGRVYQTILRL